MTYKSREQLKDEAYQSQVKESKGFFDCILEVLVKNERGDNE